MKKMFSLSKTCAAGKLFGILIGTKPPRFPRRKTASIVIQFSIEQGKVSNKHVR